jgi:hypothetical protein
LKSLRSQIDTLEVSLHAHVKDSDEATKRIIDAIIKQRDIFETVSQAQGVEFLKLHQDTWVTIENQHVMTREEMKLQTERLGKIQSTGNKKTREQMTSIGEDIIGTMESMNKDIQAEHETTRSQITELKEALSQLSQQIKQRDRDLQDLLAAFNRTRSKKKRKQLKEQTDAITAALLALQTAYKSLQVCFRSGSRLCN